MFVTAAPWMHQALTIIIFSVLGAVIAGMSLGMINGYLKATRFSVDKTGVTMVAVLGAGLLIVAVETLIRSAAPSLSPAWASYSDLGMRWPALALALGSVVGLVVVGTAYMLLINTADRFTNSWTRRKPLTVVLFVLIGLLFTDVTASSTILFWLIGGAAKGLLLWLAYVLILRFRLSLAPMLYLPVLLIFNVKGFILNAFPGAQAGYALGFVISIAVSIVWERWMRKVE